MNTRPGGNLSGTDKHEGESPATRSPGPSALVQEGAQPHSLGSLGAEPLCQVHRALLKRRLG